MAKDKAKDDKYLNVMQQHEIDCVANQYPEKDREEIKKY